MSIGTAAAALACGALVAEATPASAAASDCPQGYFCAWFDSGYSGSRYQSASWSAGWGQTFITNNDSSWRNNFTAVRDVFVIDGSTVSICIRHPSRGQSQVGFNAAANDRGNQHTALVTECPR